MSQNIFILFDVRKIAIKWIFSVEILAELNGNLDVHSILHSPLLSSSSCLRHHIQHLLPRMLQ